MRHIFARMSITRSENPDPPNPYRIHAAMLGLLWLSGLSALGVSDGPSRAHPLPFLAGVMLLTVASLVSFGVAYAWVGFGKRFPREKLVAYWEIHGGEWDDLVARGRRGNKRAAILLVGVFPGMIFLTMLVIAWSEGELVGILPLAGFIWIAMAGGFAAVVLTQVMALRGRSGRVWLSQRGLLVNGEVLLCDSFGITVLDARLLPAESGAELVVRYLVQSGRAVGEHELRVPVPSEQRMVVEETVSGWLPPGR